MLFIISQILKDLIIIVKYNILFELPLRRAKGLEVITCNQFRHQNDKIEEQHIE